MLRRSFLGLAAAALTLPGLSSAQTFPSRTLTLVVPFAAGGPSDVIARLLAQSLTATLGQQVVIENVAGAGGTAGAARVARADPDGHTLLIHHIALAAGASLYKNLSYDTLTDLEPLGLVNQGPMVLLARKDYPAATAQELLARLKAEGAKTTMGHAGIGSNAHLCGLLLQQALGAKLTEVAYRGTGPALNDLMAGTIDIMFDQSTTAVPQVQGGRVKAYGVTSRERLAVLQDLPTMAEAGVPRLDFVLWHGLYASKGTPAGAVEVLNRALRTALADATIRTRFAEAGTQLYPEAELSPAAHRSRLAREVAVWREVVAISGVSAGN